MFGLDASQPVGTNGMSFDEPRYDSGFDFSRGEAQDALARVCEKARSRARDLAVRRAQCLMDDFEVFLRTQGQPVWPGGAGHQLMSDFLATPAGTGWRQQAGFSQDGSRVTWVCLSFITNLPSRMPAEDAWAWSKQWDSFVDEVNQEERNNFIGTAFHTSVLWVRAETETRLVQTTLMCAVFSVSFAFLTVLLFLGNLALAVYVILGIVCIAVCLTALMFGAVGWKFGPVEAVGLIVFVGFSVDYMLHLAETFSQSELKTRFLRTQEALLRTGGAIVAASVTTFLAGLPILFCTIQVFMNFGTMVIANTAISLVFSIVFFSAVLMVAGPDHGCIDPRLTSLGCCGSTPGGPDDTAEECDNEVNVGTVVVMQGGPKEDGSPAPGASDLCPRKTGDDHGAQRLRAQANPSELTELGIATQPPWAVPLSPDCGSLAAGAPAQVSAPSRGPGLNSPDFTPGSGACSPQLFGRPA